MLRQLLIGLLIVTFLLMRPQGLLREERRVSRFVEELGEESALSRVRRRLGRSPPAEEAAGSGTRGPFPVRPPFDFAQDRLRLAALAQDERISAGDQLHSIGEACGLVRAPHLNHGVQSRACGSPWGEEAGWLPEKGRWVRTKGEGQSESGRPRLGRPLGVRKRRRGDSPARRRGQLRSKAISSMEAGAPSTYCQISMKPVVTSPASFQSRVVAAPW